MPRIMTNAYRNRTYILPYSDDKSECAYVKPVTDSMINKIRNQAASEAGADEQLAAKYFTLHFLEESITDWKGFFDVAGQEIPFTRESLKEICECDPAFVEVMAVRIRNVARQGELAEIKN